MTLQEAGAPLEARDVGRHFSASQSWFLISAASVIPGCGPRAPLRTYRLVCCSVRQCEEAAAQGFVQLLAGFYSRELLVGQGKEERGISKVWRSWYKRQGFGHWALTSMWPVMGKCPWVAQSLDQKGGSRVLRRRLAKPGFPAALPGCLSTCSSVSEPGQGG